MSDTQVVAINGPRQSGKTTLAKTIVASGWRYLTFDDQTVLEAANSNPVGFVRDLDKAVIDEIQRAPALMLALKRSIDADRRPGCFLITGSARTSATAWLTRSPAYPPKAVVVHGSNSFSRFGEDVTSGWTARAKVAS